MKIYNKNYRKARVLIAIPLIVFIVSVACAILAVLSVSISEDSPFYGIFAAISLINLVFTPLPCLILALFGTIYARKAERESVPEARKLCILGIVEMIASILFLAIGSYIFFVGQSI